MEYEDSDHPVLDGMAAEELLDSSLVEEEVARLLGIRQEMNVQLDWRALTTLSLTHILQSMEETIFDGNETVCSNIPFESLFDSEQDFLNGDDRIEKARIRRNFVLLHLVKKLLGALKTRVKQELAAIPLITWDEEEEAKRRIAVSEAVCALDQEELRASMENRSSSFRSSRTIDGRTGREVGEEKKVPPKPVDGETVIRAKLQRKKDCQGLHTSVRVRWVGGVQETICKFCGALVEKGPSKLYQNKEALPEGTKLACVHPGGEWVPGQEGTVARCTECQEILPNPETYRWRQAGLEPYGDDPNQDQIIALGWGATS